jgi:hypothetical protein
MLRSRVGPRPEHLEPAEQHIDPLWVGGRPHIGAAREPGIHRVRKLRVCGACNT